MLSNTKQPKTNWKVVTIALVLITIGLGLTGGIRIVLVLFAFAAILFSMVGLVRLVITKTGNPYIGMAVFLLLFAALSAWMNWQDSADHTILGFFKEMGLASLGFGAVPAIILSIIGFIRYWQKHYPPIVKAPPPDEISGLEKAFQKWYLIGAGLLFLGWVLFGYISYLLLKIFGDWYFSRLIQGVYVASEDPAIWGIIALFLGMYLSYLFVDLFLRVIQKEKYSKIKEYYEYRMGFINKGAGRSVALLYIVIILCLLYFNLATFTRFTESKIAIHRFYQITEQIYRYTDVVKIQRDISSHGQSTDNVFKITFSDGNVWKTTSYSVNNTPPKLIQIMEFASKKSGIPYEQITIIDE